MLRRFQVFTRSTIKNIRRNSMELLAKTSYVQAPLPSSKELLKKHNHYVLQEFKRLNDSGCYLLVVDFLIDIADSHYNYKNTYVYIENEKKLIYFNWDGEDENPRLYSLDLFIKTLNEMWGGVESKDEKSVLVQMKENKKPIYIPSHVVQKLITKNCSHNRDVDKLILQKQQRLIFPVSPIPGVTGTHPVVYKKTTHKVIKNEYVDIITTNQNPAKNASEEDEFHSFIWHTTADNFKKAVRWGIVATYSVTGKVIAALGKYRLIATERIAEGMVSNRYLEKEALVDLYQDRIEALQEIESLVNKDNSEADYLKAFDTYTTKLTNIANELETRFKDTEFSQYDTQGIHNMQVAIHADIYRVFQYRCGHASESVTPSKLTKLGRYVSRLIQDKHNLAEENRATGMGSILTFVKTQALHTLKEMQNVNQNMTYSLHQVAVNRGDLNSCIEDGLKEIETYNADPRNCTTAEHHGRFGKREERVIYDSSKQYLAYEREQRALLAISFITGANDIAYIKEKKITGNETEASYFIVTNNDTGRETKLKESHATKWYVGGGFLTSVKYTAAWFVNVFCIRLPFGILDLATLGLIPVLSWLSTREVVVKNPVAPKLAGENIRHRALRPLLSPGNRLRHFIVTAIKNSVFDILKGVRDVSEQFSIGIYHAVRNDYLNGKNEVVMGLHKYLDGVRSQLDEIKQRKEHHFQTTLQELEKTYHTQVDKAPNSAPVLKVAETLTVPEYLLTPGEWNDLMNAGAHGADEFMQVFMHNIYAKHPFTGLLYTLAFAAGGFAVLAPQMVAFLGSNYIAFSSSLSAAMASGKIGGAIAGGSTQAQMLAPAWEFIVNGGKSWLVTGARKFALDPATAITYSAMAIGLGAAFAYGHFPFLSKMIREDLGKFPPAALIFAGAKLGVLVVELLHEKEPHYVLGSPSANNLREYLKELYKKLNPKVADKEMNAVVEAALANLIASRVKLRDKLELSIFLTAEKEHLSHLSEETKHKLAQRINMIFSNDRYQGEALKKSLYPERELSILRTTINIITTCLVEFPIRVLFAAGSSVLQRSPKPLAGALDAYGERIEKDVARLVRAVSKLIKIAAAFVRRILKTVADIVFNSICARFWSIGVVLTAKPIAKVLRRDAYEHHFANGNYAVSAASDVQYEHSRQFISTPVDALVKDVTYAHTASVRSSSYVHLQKHGLALFTHKVDAVLPTSANLAAVKTDPILLTSLQPVMPVTTYKYK